MVEEKQKKTNFRVVDFMFKQNTGKRTREKLRITPKE